MPNVRILWTAGSLPGDFDRHGAGVDIYTFTIDHAGVVILALDRKTVAVLKLLNSLWQMGHIKHFKFSTGDSGDQGESGSK